MFTDELRTFIDYIEGKKGFLKFNIILYKSFEFLGRIFEIILKINNSIDILLSFKFFLNGFRIKILSMSYRTIGPLNY